MSLRRRWKSLAALSVTIALAGCVESTAIFSTGGSYRLETVDGSPLPFQISQTAGGFVAVESGQLDLYSDNTFQDRLVYEILESGGRRTQSEVKTGTWQEGSGVVTFTTTAGSYQGGFGGRSITLYLSPATWPPGVHTLVYTK
jgi:hypothetical protein